MVSFHRAWLCIFMVLICSCSGMKDRPKITPSSYTLVGRNYTHAIYNSENRLITHPLEDLFHEMKRRAIMGENPVSDIYVVSHGWNYTGGLAEINYHNYIDMFDKYLEKNDDKSFQPYLILVTWTSTVRPISSLANAVLPLNLDEVLRPISSFVDRGPVHLVTAWKQAMNAGTIALGRDLPDAYLETSWADEPYGVRETYYDERDTGQDLPLSALIYEILSAKHPKLANNNFEPLPVEVREQCPLKSYLPHLLLLAETNNVANQISNVLSKVKLHLVGHSYGAKLVALAGMEGLRRWVLLHYLGYPQRNDLDTCEDEAKSLIKEERYRQIELMGSTLTNQSVANKTIQQLYNDNSHFLEEGPIESLLMISPAAHPGEFQYFTDLAQLASSATLKLIARKAIVYSLYDRANGWAFNLRDMLLNTQIAQYFQATISMYDQLGDKKLNTTAFRSLNAAYNGPIALGYSLAYGAIYYAVSFAFNTPADFVHHVNHNTFNGNLVKPLDEDSVLLSVGKRILNSIDYFLPLVPPFPFRHEDEQGIARLTRPGLGKTGLIRTGVGRSGFLSLGNLKEFFEKSRDIGPELVCSFSSEILEDYTPIGPQVGADEILSLDASRIYNSVFSIAGGHGDVREFDKAKCEIPDKDEIQKRLHTLYLVINFTKSNYITWLGTQQEQ